MFTSLINRFTSSTATRPSSTTGVELPSKEGRITQVSTDSSHRSVSQRAYDFCTYLPGKLWNSIPSSNQKERTRFAQEKAAFQQYKPLFQKLGLSEKFEQLDQAYNGLATLYSWGYHETASAKYKALRTAKEEIINEFKKIETYWSQKPKSEMLGMTFDPYDTMDFNELEESVPEAVRNMKGYATLVQEEMTPFGVKLREGFREQGK